MRSNDPFKYNQSHGRYTHRQSVEFRDAWEDDFDRFAKRGLKVFGVWWFVSLIVSIVLWGVVIWGIIEVVRWVTTK